MKFTAIASIFFCAVASAQYVDQSKPFHLVISSKDKSIDGQQFAACHTGAAIESFCIAGNQGEKFYKNYTKGETSPLKGYEATGIIVWNLPSTPSVISSAMTFSQDLSTNVALPLLFPGSDSAQDITFDKSGALAIISYLDDTHTPPTAGKPRALKNWYLCQTNYLSYQYHTLAWVDGTTGAKPQNPSCVKIDVIRKYVK